MNPDDQQSDQQQVASDPPPTTPGDPPAQDAQPPVAPDVSQDPVAQPDPPTYTQPESFTQEPQDQPEQPTEPVSPPPPEPETQPTVPPQDQQFQVEEMQQQEPPPTTTPPAHQDAKPKGKTNVFAIVGVFVIVILLGLVAFLVMQNNQLKSDIAQAPPPPVPTLMPTLAPTSAPIADPTAEWEIFTSSIYKVSYPTDITVTEVTGSVLVLSKQGTTQTPDTELFDGISLMFEPKEISDTTLEEYVNARVDEVTKEGIATVTSDPSPTTVGKYTGLTYTTEGLGVNRYTVLESENGAMFMVITDVTVDPENVGFSDTVDLILSTFEFTE